jgi:hypothetical protein
MSIDDDGQPAWGVFCLLTEVHRYQRLNLFALMNRSARVDRGWTPNANRVFEIAEACAHAARRESLWHPLGGSNMRRGAPCTGPRYWKPGPVSPTITSSVGRADRSSNGRPQRSWAASPRLKASPAVSGTACVF